jgi:RNA polymerase sigma factor (sigma-70 family)
MKGPIPVGNCNAGAVRNIANHKSQISILVRPWTRHDGGVNRERLQELFGSGRRGVFASTQWSMVVAAAERDSAAAQEALAELCAIYWYPLYAFARRLGHAPEDAQDLVQGFFARVLQSRWLEAASPEGGKFRSWLLASFRHHLADEHARATAHKRGGGQVTLSLDAFKPEERFAIEPRETDTPEKRFERRWAMTVLEQVLKRLRAAHQAEGKAAQFAALEQTLPGGTGELAYSQIARQLNLSEGAVKVAVHRLRERYRQTLREEIARTVQFPNQIDDEIRHLMEALGAGK